MQKRRERVEKWRMNKKVQEIAQAQSELGKGLKATHSSNFSLFQSIFVFPIANHKAGKKWSLEDDDEEEEEESKAKAEPSVSKTEPSEAAPEATIEEDDDVDPLDAFMQVNFVSYDLL